MTDRIRPRVLFRGVACAVIALAAVCVCAQSSGEITSFVDDQGRVVYTNIMRTPSKSTPPLTADFHGPSNRRTAAYDALIEGISAEHGVDATLVRAIIQVESDFGRFAVSPMDARGLMQLIPETSARFGVADPFDAAQNIQGGVRYLRFLLETFDGRIDLALAAYNAGEGRVRRAGRVPNIPETRAYVQKVRDVYERIAGRAPRRLAATYGNGEPGGVSVPMAGTGMSGMASFGTGP